MKIIIVSKKNLGMKKINYNLSQITYNQQSKPTRVHQFNSTTPPHANKHVKEHRQKPCRFLSRRSLGKKPVLKEHTKPYHPSLYCRLFKLRGNQYLSSFICAFFNMCDLRTFSLPPCLHMYPAKEAKATPSPQPQPYNSSLTRLPSSVLSNIYIFNVPLYNRLTDHPSLSHIPVSPPNQPTLGLPQLSARPSPLRSSRPTRLRT